MKVFNSSLCIAVLWSASLASHAGVQSLETGKPLIEVLAGIRDKTGMQFKVSQALAQNHVSFLEQSDLNESLKLALAGYNYSAVWQGDKIESLIVSGLNGNAAELEAKKTVVPRAFARFSEHAIQRFEFSKDQLLAMKPGQRIDFNLPEGQVSMVYDRVMSHANGDKTWVGHTGKESFMGASFLTLGQNGVTVGSIKTDQHVYLIEYAEGQTWMIDTKAAGIKEVPQHDGTEIVSSKASSVKAASAASKPTAQAAAVSGATVLDIFVYYSSGMNAVTADAKINNLIAVTNTAYINSGLDVSMNLVGTKKVDYDDAIPNDTALDDLSNKSGVFSNVDRKRARFGADLMTFIRPYNVNSGSCGVAYVSGEYGGDLFMEDGYSVVSEEDSASLSDNGSYCDDTTLAHETGHNLGNEHDRANAGGAIGHFSYSYGYCQTTVDSNGDIIGDVMSYCKVVPIYSNPNIFHDNQPMGVAKAFSNSAFVAKTIRQTAPIASRFSTRP